jgi:hypothetical protein
MNTVEHEAANSATTRKETKINIVIVKSATGGKQA